MLCLSNYLYVQAIRLPFKITYLLFMKICMQSLHLPSAPPPQVHIFLVKICANAFFDAHRWRWFVKPVQIFRTTKTHVMFAVQLLFGFGCHERVQSALHWKYRDNISNAACAKKLISDKLARQISCSLQ